MRFQIENGGSFGYFQVINVDHLIRNKDHIYVLVFQVNFQWASRVQLLDFFGPFVFLVYRKPRDPPIIVILLPYVRTVQNDGS